MKKQNIAKAELSPESAADLFATSCRRYFEQPGDAGGNSYLPPSIAPSVTGLINRRIRSAGRQRGSLADPIVLAQQM